jgi:chaperonin GroES
MEFPIRPLYDQLFVRQAQAKDKEGNIHLPDSAQKRPNEGLVLAVGPGWVTKQGVRLPMAMKAGDVVLFDQRAGHIIHVDLGEGLERLMVLRESDCLAVIDKESL